MIEEILHMCDHEHMQIIKQSHDIEFTKHKAYLLDVGGAQILDILNGLGSLVQELTLVTHNKHNIVNYALAHLHSSLAL